MPGLKYIGPKGKGPERPILGPYFEIAGNYVIPFSHFCEEEIVNAVDSAMRKGDLYITSTWNLNGEYDVWSDDFNSMGYILYQIEDLQCYNFRVATKDFFIEKGGDYVSFYKKYLKLTDSGHLVLSEKAYYSNERLQDFIDKVLLFSQGWGENLVIGKTPKGDFVFYLGTDIGS